MMDRTTRPLIVVAAFASSLVVGLVAALIAAAFVRMPYYRFSPGSLYPTESLVTVRGAASFAADGGQVDFTTVSSKKASVLDYYFAHFDEAVELAKRFGSEESGAFVNGVLDRVAANLGRVDKDR